MSRDSEVFLRRGKRIRLAARSLKALLTAGMVKREERRPAQRPCFRSVQAAWAPPDPARLRPDTRPRSWRRSRSCLLPYSCCKHVPPPRIFGLLFELLCMFPSAPQCPLLSWSGVFGVPCVCCYKPLSHQPSLLVSQNTWGPLPRAQTSGIAGSTRRAFWSVHRKDRSTRPPHWAPEGTGIPTLLGLWPGLGSASSGDEEGGAPPGRQPGDQSQDREARLRLHLVFQRERAGEAPLGAGGIMDSAVQSLGCGLWDSIAEASPSEPLSLCQPGSL